MTGDAPRVTPVPDVAADIEQRLRRLESQVQILAEAIRTLARGLEEIPSREPQEHRIAHAARLAHEILISSGL